VNEGFAALPVTSRVAFREHVVTKGQTAGGIAKRYGVSLAALREANPEIKAKPPRPGQRLVIPTGAAAKWSESDVGGGGSRTHTVTKGETLGGIASRYRVSVSQLRTWNDLSSSTIRVGQKLRVGGSGRTSRQASSQTVRRSSSQAVKPSGGQTHVVRSGETLSAVARRYGVSVKALMTANDMSSSRLKAGQKLRIPA